MVKVPDAKQELIVQVRTLLYQLQNVILLEWKKLFEIVHAMIVHSNFCCFQMNGIHIVVNGGIAFPMTHMAQMVLDSLEEQ